MKVNLQLTSNQVRKGDSTLDREGRANATTQNTSIFGSTSSPGKDLSPSKTSSMVSASLKGQALGGGKTSTQDKAATQTESPTQDKESRQSDAPTVGRATPQSKAVVQPTPPSTQGKATAQSKAATQRKAITQPAPPATQVDAAPADPSGWETNVDYPISINAPEFISPTKKDFPNGRPNKDGNLPLPRPPRVSRGAPHELERLRQIRDRLNQLNRKDALRQHLKAGPQNDSNTSSGSGGSTRAANIDSVVGSVTVRAGSAPAPSTGPQRSTIQGTSRANVIAGTAPAPPAKALVVGETPTATTTTTTQTTTAATKSARVEKKPGKGLRTGRNVRFGPLPTEADTGRERRKGLRTRSGALHEKQRKSGKGVGK